MSETTIRLRRGRYAAFLALAESGGLSEGEWYFCLDTGHMAIGTGYNSYYLYAPSS